MSQNNSLPKLSFLPDIGSLSPKQQSHTMPGISIEDDLGKTPVLQHRQLKVQDGQPQLEKPFLKSPSKVTFRVSSPMASVMSSCRGRKTPESEISVCDFPKDILTDLEESFCVFDQSGDGCINPGKLQKIANYAVRDITTEAEVQDQILEIDNNGDGTVEFDEYFDMMKSKVLNPPNDKDIEKAFQVFDVNHSGSVEADDLFQMMRQLGVGLTMTEVKDMVKAVEGVTSKSVSFQDFKHLAQGRPPSNLNAILAEHGLDEDVVKVIPMADKTVAVDCFPELLNEFL